MPLNDLNQMFSIVDPSTGKPTDYFMRLLRDRGIDTDNLVTTVAELETEVTSLATAVNNIDGTVFTAGTGLGGGGTLGTDDPITFNLTAGIDDLSDVDTSTTPPTDGQALVWVDADSSWKPGDVASGGGGGGSSWTEQTLTNYNFATGDLSGWTSFAGSFTNVADTLNPMGGGRRIDSGANSTNALYQDIDVSAFSTDIDNGNFEAYTDVAWRSGFTDDDHAEPLILCLDGSGTDLGRIVGNLPERQLGSGLIIMTRAQGIVPINTRTLRVFAITRRESGSNCDADIYGVRVFARSLTTSAGGGSTTRAIFRDEKAASTDGGSWTSGSWTTRTLNTEHYNNITGASLSSNEITIPAGTYKVFARVPGFRVDRFKSRLYNVTDSAIALEGSTAFSDSGDSQANSSLQGVITITGTKTFRVEMISTGSRSTFGAGLSYNGAGGGTEIYTSIEIEKIA